MPHVDATQTKDNLPVCEFLIRRNGRYSIRRRIPQDLVAHYGKAEITKALGTSDPKVAAQLCRTEAVRLDQEWDAIRATTFPSPCLPSTSPAPLATSETDTTVRASQILAALRAQRAQASAQGYQALQEWSEKQTFAMQVDNEVLQGGFEPVYGSVAEHEAARNARRALLTGENAMLLHEQPHSPVARSLTPIATVIGLWEKEKPRQQRTMDAKRTEIQRYSTMTGIEHIESITKANVRAFRDQMLAAGFSPKNTNKYLDSLRALLNFAVSEDLIPANTANGVKANFSNAEDELRKPFPLDALNAVFSSSIYAANARPAGGAGEAAYWLPLLGLFTGARLEEIGQLHPNDVYEESAPDHSLTAWVIRITDGEGQSLKNITSRRRIPVHPTLIELGFIEYVAVAKAEGRHRIFDKLKKNKYEKHTAAWSQWFSRQLRRTLNITDTGLVFHSFRHTFKDYCRAMEIPEDVHDAITGHTNDSIARKYGGNYPLLPLVNAMAKYKVSGLELAYPEPPRTK